MSPRHGHGICLFVFKLAVHILTHLREEGRLRVFENRVLREMLGGERGLENTTQ